MIDERREKLARRTGVTLYRDVSIEQIEERQLVNADDRTVDLTFSSDAPIERWGDIEILEHSDEAVRMERLDSGTVALLLGHGGARDQIGVVERAWLDGGRAHATARFGRSDLADEIMRDVDDGIRRLVSVGYQVHQWTVKQNDSAPWEFRATDWEPVEISIVPVPADPTVGVVRSLADGERTQEAYNMPRTTGNGSESEHENDVGTPTAGVDADDTRTDDEVIAAADREKECGEMRTLAKRFSMNEACDGLIAADGTMADLKAAIRQKIMAPPQAVPTGTRIAEHRDTRITGGRPNVYSPNGRAAVTRWGEEVTYVAGMWARAALLGCQRSLGWCNERGLAAFDDQRGKMVRSGVEGIFAKGGALVPEEMSMMIIDLRETYGIARQWTTVHPMQSDSVSVPKRTGGVTAYFVGEETEPTASDKDWTDVGLVAKKLGAQCKFSSEYAEDAVIDVGADFADEISYAFAEKEDDCLFNGDGTSTYGGVVGILAKIIDGNHAAGAVDAASGIDTFAEVTADDLSTLIAALPQYAQQSANWYGSVPCKALVWDSLAQAGGGNTMSTIADGPRFQYLGQPIVLSQKLPTSTGDLSNLAMLLYGDLARAVLFGDRRGLRTRLLTERYAEKDQLAVVGFERFDINVHSLGDGTTAGPVVALIGE